jgi:hypothetical protein
MTEPELSKRIDDLPHRFDDLRANVGRQFSDLKADMATRFAATDKRIISNCPQTPSGSLWA